MLKLFYSTVSVLVLLVGSTLSSSQRVSAAEMNPASELRVQDPSDLQIPSSARSSASRRPTPLSTDQGKKPISSYGASMRAPTSFASIR